MKRGLSPIIATVLLISIAVILAGIIFAWAYSFVGESLSKQGRAIEQACEEVQFDAEVEGSVLYINNIGDVPLWGVEIKVRNSDAGDITNLNEFPDEEGISKGESVELDLEGYLSSDFNGEIILSPILLGETRTERQRYICDENFGKRIEN